MAAILLGQQVLTWKTPIFCALLLAALATARAIDPMTTKEIAMLLRNGEDQHYIISETARRHLLQSLSPAEERTLVSLRASPALMTTLHDPAIVASAEQVTAFAAHLKQQQLIAFQSEQEARRQAAAAAQAARQAQQAAQPPAGAPTDPSVGRPIALKFKAVDGSAVDLEQMKGKVVMLDFWATWCGPCMQEVPNVVAAYNKYHSKGFEIIGVSLDQDKSAMLRTTAQKGMTWPQYFDGKGWSNPISTAFHIQAIPAMWLINKNGVVATTDARENLDSYIQRLLAE